MEKITHKELKEIILCACKNIEKNKDQINKINVFPVPDQDTGTNIAKTLSGIKEIIENKEFNNLSELSESIIEGALNAAQGNAGVIYTGFLAGFLSNINENSMDAANLSLGFKFGYEKARQSIQKPKEGTILDVIEASSDVFEEESKKEKNIIVILKKAIEKARDALLATREKMEIFRKANVVDAGGLAFLIILESYLEALEKRKTPSVKTESSTVFSESVKKFIQTISYRYEVIFLIKNSRIKNSDLQKNLSKFGNSIETLTVGNRVKVHIHTDDPDSVRKIAYDAGHIESLRVEDIAKEISGEESVKKISIGIVTDDITGLTQKVIQRYKIELARMEELDDKSLKIISRNINISPETYLKHFEKQLEKFEKIICITISSNFSNCYKSALLAKKMSKDSDKISIFNSRTIGPAQSLIVLKAIELILAGEKTEEILRELKRFSQKTFLFVNIGNLQKIENIGRIGRLWSDWIRKNKKINICPILEINQGRILKRKVFNVKDSTEAFVEIIKKRQHCFKIKEKKPRALVFHFSCPEKAEQLRKSIKEIGFEIPFVTEIPLMVSKIIGSGSLMVTIQC